MMLGRPGFVVLEGRVACFAEALRGHERALVRVRGRDTAGATIRPGRLCVLIGGRAVNGAPSAGPVLGVALARPHELETPEGDFVLIARGAIVVSDGELGGDLEPARVDASGRFVRTGGEAVPSCVCAPCGVEINL